MMEYHGRRLELRMQGESHSPEMRVTVTGLPAGEPAELEPMRALLARRRPGQSDLTTGRRETDEPELLCGVRDGVLTGEPVVIRFWNEDCRPEDYAAMQTVPRPGHADYTQYLQSGRIPAGGGALGGRMTLLLCAAGGGLGLAAAQKQERRWGQVHTFARLLSYIGQTLQYLPLPAADLLERAAAYPEFAALGAAACTQLSDLAPPTALPAPKRDEMQSLLRAAGESDRAGACEMLAAAAALCEDAAAERLPALRQARCLWPKLGVCAGLLAAVLWG